MERSFGKPARDKTGGVPVGAMVLLSNPATGAVAIPGGLLYCDATSATLAHYLNESDKRYGETRVR